MWRRAVCYNFTDVSDERSVSMMTEAYSLEILAEVCHTKMRRVPEGSTIFDTNCWTMDMSKNPFCL
jgi:hypothetical protein